MAGGKSRQTYTNVHTPITPTAWFKKSPAEKRGSVYVWCGVGWGGVGGERQRPARSVGDRQEGGTRGGLERVQGNSGLLLPNMLSLNRGWNRDCWGQHTHTLVFLAL